MRESRAGPCVEVSELVTHLRAAADTDPAMQAHAEQCLEGFIRALERLSPKVRATFVLHRQYGLTLAQISGELGISFPMAKKYLVKALSDRAILLLNGRIEAQGTPNDVINRYIGLVLARQQATNKKEEPIHAWSQTRPTDLEREGTNRLGSARAHSEHQRRSR